MAALHAKLIVSDVKKSLVSSANLSYHGMQGNIEMGFLIESHEKAKQIEEVMKEMVRMKVFGKQQWIKTLMKMFNMIGIGERAGSGILDIYQVWENEGWPMPIVEESNNPDMTHLTLKLKKW